jgi:hypothetical protein
MPNTIASLRPDVVSIHLRLPKSLHRRLVKEAKTNRVALNTEIVNQLEGRRLALVEDFKETLREFFFEEYYPKQAAQEGDPSLLEVDAFRRAIIKDLKLDHEQQEALTKQWIVGLQVLRRRSTAR